METQRFVYVGDPALDVRKMKIRGPGGYAETRDASQVVALPDRRPVWFEIRWLTPRESIIVDEQGSVLRKARRALAFALVSVVLPNGAALRPTLDFPDVNGASERRVVWDDDELDMLTRRFGKAAMLDIAGAVLEKDEQPGEDFASGDARFTLLPSSLAALEQSERRLAAQTLDESATPT